MAPRDAPKFGLHTLMSRAVTPAPSDALQQTQLAHIGHVQTAEGRYEIAYQRIVIKGMLAPRGQQHLHVFLPDGTLVRSYSFFSAEPLWCEGAKLYLFGCIVNSGGIPFDSRLEVEAATMNGAPSGNVIDFSGGLDHAIVRWEFRYGSSGGIEDGHDGRVELR